MAHWAEDARMLPPDVPALEGKTAIRSYVESALDLPGFGISSEPLSVHVAGSRNMAYMIERNVITVHDSLGIPSTTYGKVVTVWQKDAAGSWKNVADMWDGVPAPGN